MTDRRLRGLWDALQGKMPDIPHFLAEVSLQGIRGIDDLRVKFRYPVSVIAGDNGSGKSTVLFAAACAYKVPGVGVRKFVPSALFPGYQPKSGKHGDQRGATTFQFQYLTPDGLRSMQLRYTDGRKKWNRSFFGRKGARQPERPVYLRTLSNLTNPSEVRGVLSLSHLASDLQETPLTASQIKFAQRLLPFKYSMVTDLSRTDLLRGRGKSLLVATQENGTEYSELHMAAGERAILRLSQDIADAKGALVLIDEVEAGLHPVAQRILMQELQYLALRNDLQIIVTTHSQVVLDSVHETGRIFLERDEAGGVSVHPPYRDLIQDAFYGRLDEKLNLLCEDKIAESLLHGVFDIITLRLNAKREAIRIGRDMGAEGFPMYAKAFERFGQLQNFILVLDGDRRKTKLEQMIQKNTKHEARVVFLPGEDAPEVWVWKKLEDLLDESAKDLGIASGDFYRQMSRLNALYDVAVDSPAAIAKAKLYDLSEVVDRPNTEICRMVARREAGRPASDIQPLVEYLDEAFREWRSGT